MNQITIDWKTMCKERDEIIERLETKIKELEERLKEKAENITNLKNVLRSDELQIKNLTKRNVEMRDDCIKTAHDRDIANQENTRFRQVAEWHGWEENGDE